MEKKLYPVLNAFDMEEELRDFLLNQCNTLALSRNAWSGTAWLTEAFSRSVPQGHYGLDSDITFLHIARVLEPDLIKRIGEEYYYELSDYTLQLFNRETLFSSESDEFGFHKHFYGFSDVIMFYEDDLLRGVISSGTGQAVLNLSQEEKKQLQKAGFDFDKPLRK